MKLSKRILIIVRLISIGAMVATSLPGSLVFKSLMLNIIPLVVIGTITLNLLKSYYLKKFNKIL
jgi:hypothetical protein